MSRRREEDSQEGREETAHAASAAADPRRRGPGRPPVYNEKWTKVTVVLFDRQIAFLDALTESIRIKKDASISRAQLLRALVDALGESGMDLTTCASTSDVKAAVLSRLSNAAAGSHRASLATLPGQNPNHRDEDDEQKGHR